MKKLIPSYVILAIMAFVSIIIASDVTKQDNFWRDAAQAGMTEITLANLALKRSTNDDIKKFAQMIVDDHTKAQAELKTLAIGKSITLPADVNSKQSSTINDLISTSADKFDKEFVKIMVKDHEGAVALFQQESDTSVDPDLKIFAASTLPTLKAHLDAANALSATLKSKK